MELTPEQNIALVRDFVETHIPSKGMVADWVYHDNPGNPHIHLKTTLRPLTEDGFGAKKVRVLCNDGQPTRTKSGRIIYGLWAGSTDDFNVLRDGWFEWLNDHLALGGMAAPTNNDVLHRCSTTRSSLGRQGIRGHGGVSRGVSG